MIPLARLASKLPTRQLNATGREVVSQTNKFHGRISRENFTREFHRDLRGRERGGCKQHARTGRVTEPGKPGSPPEVSGWFGLDCDWLNDLTSSPGFALIFTGARGLFIEARGDSAVRFSVMLRESQHREAGIVR